MQRAAATLQGAQSDNTMAQKEFEETKTQFEMDADSELETLRCRREPLLHTCSSSTHPAAYPAPPRVRLTFVWVHVQARLHVLGTQLEFAWLSLMGMVQGARRLAAILKPSCRVPSRMQSPC